MMENYDVLFENTRLTKSTIKEIEKMRKTVKPRISMKTMNKIYLGMIIGGLSAYAIMQFIKKED